MERIRMTNNDLSKLMNQGCSSLSKSKDIYYLGKSNNEYTNLLSSQGIKRLKTLAWRIRKDNKTIDDMLDNTYALLLLIEYMPGQSGWYNYSIIDYEDLNEAKLDGFSIFPFLITAEHDEEVLNSMIKNVINHENVNDSIYKVQNSDGVVEIAELIDIVSIISETSYIKTFSVLERFCSSDRINSCKNKLVSLGFRDSVAEAHSAASATKKKDEVETEDTEKYTVKKKITYKSGDIIQLGTRCPDCNGKLEYAELYNGARKVLKCKKCLTEARVEQGTNNYIIRSTFANRVTREKRKFAHDIIDEIIIPYGIIDKDDIYSWIHDTLYNREIAITDVHIGNMNESELNRLVEKFIELIDNNKDKITSLPNITDKCYDWLDNIIYNKSLHHNGAKYQRILSSYVDDNKNIDENSESEIINEKASSTDKNIDEEKDSYESDKYETPSNSIDDIIRKIVRQEISKLSNGGHAINNEIIEDIKLLKEQIAKINDDIIDTNSILSSMGERETYNLSQYNKLEKNISNIQETVKTYRSKVVEIEKTVKGMSSDKEFARQIMRNLAN